MYNEAPNLKFCILIQHTLQKEGMVGLYFKTRGPVPPVMQKGCPRRIGAHGLPRPQERSGPLQPGGRPADPLAAE